MASTHTIERAVVTICTGLRVAPLILQAQALVTVSPLARWQQLLARRRMLSICRSTHEWKLSPYRETKSGSAAPRLPTRSESDEVRPHKRG